MGREAQIAFINPIGNEQAFLFSQTSVLLNREISNFSECLETLSVELKQIAFDIVQEGFVFDSTFDENHGVSQAVVNLDFDLSFDSDFHGACIARFPKESEQLVQFDTVVVFSNELIRHSIAVLIKHLNIAGGYMRDTGAD